VHSERNTFDLGVPAGFAQQIGREEGHNCEVLPTDVEAVATDTEVVPADVNAHFQTVRRYVTTEIVSARSFIAEIRLDGESIMRSSTVSSPLITAVARRTMPAHTLSRSDQPLLDNTINGQKNTWEWLHVCHWHFAMPPNFRMVRSEIQPGRFLPRNHFNFQAGGEFIGGVLQRSVSPPAIPPINSLSLLEIKQGLNVSGRDARFNLNSGNISAYSYTEYQMRASHLNISNNWAHLQFIDNFGNTYRYRISRAENLQPSIHDD
jgi:hypothetical protein